MTSTSICLWYSDKQAEAAAEFYVSLLPDSRIDHVMRAPGEYPAGQRGDVLMIEFTLNGRSFQALNGRSEGGFTDAFSIAVTVEDQAEVDRLWSALTADGGEPIQCGWLKDRWGVRWQIVPRGMIALLGSADKAVAQRAFAAMMTMIKIDIAAIEAACAEKGAP